MAVVVFCAGAGYLAPVAVFWMAAILLGQSAHPGVQALLPMIAYGGMAVGTVVGIYWAVSMLRQAPAK